MTYNHKSIEKKWQTYWEDNDTFQTDAYNMAIPKYYILDMFPYPSGNGLHVGHPEGYTATDIIARMKRMQGYNVMHPMGWDSFGLPAEQYALQTGNHPKEFTDTNIQTFKRQIQELGFSYDWSREIATSHADYYKWTQWIFTKLYDRGLAYVDEIPVNWCPELGSVLANEEVIDGKSERGNYPVYRRPMRQWILKITDYAERLLEDLDLVSWPQSTKEMQINWIGKSQGAHVVFAIADTDKEFTVFTTRADTLFGATYCVLAPEHPFVCDITSAAQKAAVEAYVQGCATKSDLERTELNKEKSGVFTGAYAINPINQERVPIWIADYVLASYGTGAIMAVPAHDERDYAFAKQYALPIVAVLEGGDIALEAYVGDGTHINSGFLNGMDKETALNTMHTWLKEHGCGEAKTTYKLRDWLFSRQRYWGEPIPIVHMEDGTMRTVDIAELPLELPETQNFQPSHTTGESPLSHCADWLEVEIDGMKGRRETNTMPQWAGSCWYYMRYLDPHNEQAIADSALLEHWLPVDLYVGGAEHAVLHLLYARFWHKVLYDCGIVKTKEPFKKLFHQGMILGENGEKMSKSRGNVVNPDIIIESHGADTLRIYEMFMGPLEAALPWSATGIDGSRRWIERVWRLLAHCDKKSDANSGELDYSYHFMVKKVTGDIESLNFNTAISQMMIFINDCYKASSIYTPYIKGFIKMFACFAPHVGEELWLAYGSTGTIAYTDWPLADESKLVKDEVEVIFQVNGKIRDKVFVKADTPEAELETICKASANVSVHLEGKTIRKVIAVKNKLVNIVAN